MARLVERVFLRDGWIAASLALYVITGAFWLPVVWMQMQMRDLAVRAVETNAKVVRLRPSGVRSLLIILWLIIARPPIPYRDY
jgi:uncharacterized membrane protein